MTKFLERWQSAARLEKIASLFIVLVLGSYAIIPTLGGNIFASPDETAVALVARRLAQAESPHWAESLAQDYPWLHPRSWVSRGEQLVPVGFLGWPLLLAPGVALFGQAVLPWLGVVFLLSAIYPAYKLLREFFSTLSTLLGLLVGLSFHAVVLYANRGLFPNLGLMVIFLWSLWAIRSAVRTGQRWWLVGCLGAGVIMIRPVELVWIVPWWWWAGHDLARTHGRAMRVAVAAFILALLPYLALNHLVYGGVWRIGYWLRDNPIVTMQAQVAAPSSSEVTLLPFGFHPRHMWWNVRVYTQAFLWPAVLILCLAAAVYVYEKNKRRGLTSAREMRVWWVSLWTVASLVLIYGSGIYQDHVRRGAVSAANSFLRYLLPLALLTGLAWAWLCERLMAARYARVVALTASGALAMLGVYSAVFKDDEGVWQTRRELARYPQVIEISKQYFHSGDVILSERSDKIFVHWLGLRAVSPLPPRREVARLVRDQALHMGVGLYVRPLSQRQLDEWRSEGVDVVELASFAREKLYRLQRR